MEINCKNCGPSGNWAYLNALEGEGYFACRNCGYKGRFEMPNVFNPRRIFYLDQWAISGITRRSNASYVKLRELLLRLTSRQFWLCPMFQSHFDETSRLNVADAETHFAMLQRLANGRLFKDPLEVKVAQIVRAYSAFVEGHNAVSIHWSDAYLFHNPSKVVPPFTTYVAENLGTSRAGRQDQLLDLARGAYAELRRQWAENPATFQDAQQTEHNATVGAYLDMLSAMTLGTLPKSSLLLKRGMFELYLNTTGYVISTLLMTFGNQPNTWSRLEAFFKSRHFGAVQHHVVDNVLFAYLREQAQSAPGKQTNPDKQAKKNKGDLNDAAFISVVLPYVTDILVDTKFSDIMGKPKMTPYTSRVCVWGPRDLERLISKAEEAIASSAFRIVDSLYQKLAPLEENEFAPFRSGETIIYGGEIRQV